MGDIYDMSGRIGSWNSQETFIWFLFTSFSGNIFLQAHNNLIFTSVQTGRVLENCYCMQNCAIHYVTLWREWVFISGTIEKRYRGWGARVKKLPKLQYLTFELFRISKFQRWTLTKRRTMFVCGKFCHTRLCWTTDRDWAFFELDAGWDKKNLSGNQNCGGWWDSWPSTPPPPQKQHLNNNKKMKIGVIVFVFFPRNHEFLTNKLATVI